MIYQMPEGDWAASCNGWISDGYPDKMAAVRAQRRLREREEAEGE